MMFGGFPATYSNPYYMQNQAQSVPTPTGIQQNSGFIRVQSENQARAYPIQPGMSLTFIDESMPYCYTKTLDFSQLDRPIFKRFRLVEETDAPQSAQKVPQEPSDVQAIDLTLYATKADMDVLEARIKALETKGDAGA